MFFHYSVHVWWGNWSVKDRHRTCYTAVRLPHVMKPERGQVQNLPLSHRDLHPSGLPKLWIVRQVRVQGIYGYPRHLKMHSNLIVYLIHLFDEYTILNDEFLAQLPTYLHIVIYTVNTSPVSTSSSIWNSPPLSINFAAWYVSKKNNLRLRTKI